MDAKRDKIEAMIDRAAKAAMADEAMKWSQAALNAARAMFTLAEVETGQANPKQGERP